MAEHIILPTHSPHATCPSLHHRFPPHDPPNPTLLPTSILRLFRFVFLIRDPSAAIPSLYRCFLPPLSAMTEDHELDPTELGYREMRILFEHLHPPSSSSGGPPPLLIDADDLLSDPDAVIRALCARLGIAYAPAMLAWEGPEELAFAKSLLDKLAGYHEDALHSTGLRPQPPGERRRRAQKSRGEEDAEWEAKFGAEGAKAIREAVDLCREDYEYLRGFRMGRVLE
ncbi:MAG: hypothetical protein LQ344_007474 [Seirophora lacunosa]|nr:MAG: hypothetical protein LQ344_007474 [Seirophora lacunosa]